MGEMFANHITDKILMYKIYKVFINLGANNPIQKQAVKLHKLFFQKRHPDGFFHLKKNEMKRDSTSLIIREMCHYGKQYGGASKSKKQNYKYELAIHIPLFKIYIQRK